jgi:DNA-binding protein H-NS
MGMTKAEYPESKQPSPIIEASMAKKAKRRGRPPGSKNKKSIAKSVTTMDVAQLRAHIDNLQGVLARKVTEQRSYLESQLAQLGGYVSKKASAGVKAVTPGNGAAGKRAKPKPKYQSKKNKSLKWTGRGLLPRWMREEMKGTKLKKDDFLIR